MKQTLLASAAVLMSLSVGAFAQSTPPQSNGAVMNSQPAPGVVRPADRTAETAPVAGKPTASMSAADRHAAAASAPMGSSDMFADIPAGEQLSSKVVGLEVYNAANKNIGKIKDIAFDEHGVKAYIVAVGGFLGMGDHYVAVNPPAVNISFDSNAKKWHAAMNTDADQLKAAPEYKYSSND
jgi:hypothetical protein